MPKFKVTLSIMQTHYVEADDPNSACFYAMESTGWGELKYQTVSTVEKVSDREFESGGKK